jgi:uncharacterized RDD family membrane protein YckC
MLASSGAPELVPAPKRGRESEVMAEEPMSAPGASPPAPEAPPPAPAPAPMGGWQAPPPAATLPGIPGFVYADVPNRFIALIIDGIVMGLVFVIIGIVLVAIGLDAGFTVTNADLVASVVYAILSLVVGAGYFIYTWTSMRASVGMRMLGMQVGNAFDGKTLTMEQASKRWLALWGPSTISGALTSVSGIGTAIGFLVFLYLLYLLYTTAKSPTKQGFHDVFANTVVVKAARAV